MLNDNAYKAMYRVYEEKREINGAILDRLTSMGFYYHRPTDNDPRMLAELVLEEMYVQ